MSIYHWKLGDIALARVSQKFYAKVKVVKDEKGLFYDDKVLGIEPKGEDSIEVTEELCYYVEIIRSGKRLWLPYTSLHLAERSRPFYGVDKPVVQENPKKTEKPAPKKRKIKEDYILPLEVKLSKHSEPDLNVTFDSRHTPLKQGRYENAFSEFMRRGKEMMFDHFYSLLERDSAWNFDVIDYVRNVDASTEDKFEEVIKNVVSEKEIEHYLRQCWRYNFVNKQKTSIDRDNKENIDPSDPLSPKSAITLHTTWCLVCGQGVHTGRLRECPACPSCFHLACRKEWLVKIIHRKNPPQKPQKPATLVKKILSSTRTICAVQKEKESVELCPSCMWGPKVGYDDVVWHKLGSCSWWPARVLAPGAAPSCLLSRSHSRHEWPLRYYGTLNHSWGTASRMSLFLPSHAERPELSAKDPMLQQAVLDACDDYIAVYLA